MISLSKFQFVLNNTMGRGRGSTILRTMVAQGDMLRQTSNPTCGSQGTFTTEMVTTSAIALEKRCNSLLHCESHGKSCRPVGPPQEQSAPRANH